MLPFLVVCAIVLLLGAGWFFFKPSRGTFLKKDDAERRQDVKRVYIIRPGLKAKLWFSKSKRKGRFEVRFQGEPDDFTVSLLDNEPIHLREAREALREVGLDMDQCFWEDIVAKAK